MVLVLLLREREREREKREKYLFGKKKVLQSCNEAVLSVNYELSFLIVIFFIF
jgi:hypothetical protein